MSEETAVIETPVESTPAAEPVETTTSTPESGPEATAQPAEKPQTEQEKLDRRNNPDALRKTLKWLRENGGEHSAQAQTIERILSESKNYKTVFPTVREARDIKQAIDSVGGVQKIAELQQTASRMADIDSRLEAGDPSVLDDIFETGGKGIAKLLPGVIERLAKESPQEVQAAIKPHVFTFLSSEGMDGAIDAMVRAFNADKPEDAKNVLASIVNWWKAQNQAQPEQTNPEQDAFQKERDKFYREKYEGEVTRAFDTVASHAQKLLTEKLKPTVARLGLSAESAQLLLEDTWGQVQKLRNADPLFKASVTDRFNDKKRTVSQDAAQFVQGYTDKYAEDAVKKAVQLRYGDVLGKIAPKAVPPAQAPKVDPTAPPTGAVISVDQTVTAQKLGSKSKAIDAILRGEGFDSAGKPVKKVGRAWKHA